MHGAGSLTPSVNPALSFISNFPPCLQSADLPQPGDVLTKKDLLERMPHTGTMGGMTTFYFTFVYSPPYEPLIPADGVDHDPVFPVARRPRATRHSSRSESASHAFVDVYVEEWNEALAWFRGGPRGQCRRTPTINTSSGR